MKKFSIFLNLYHSNIAVRSAGRLESVFNSTKSKQMKSAILRVKNNGIELNASRLLEKCSKELFFALEENDLLRSRCEALQKGETKRFLLGAYFLNEFYAGNCLCAVKAKESDSRSDCQTSENVFQVCL
jgi:hypothetical protein